MKRHGDGGDQALLRSLTRLPGIGKTLMVMGKQEAAAKHQRAGNFAREFRDMIRMQIVKYFRDDNQIVERGGEPVWNDVGIHLHIWAVRYGLPYQGDATCGRFADVKPEAAAREVRAVCAVASAQLQRAAPAAETGSLQKLTPFHDFTAPGVCLPRIGIGFKACFKFCKRDRAGHGSLPYHSTGPENCRSRFLSIQNPSGSSVIRPVWDL